MAEKPAIYGIHCTKTGYWYVGGSKQPIRRMKNHKREMQTDADLHRLEGNTYDFKHKGQLGQDYSVYGKRCFKFVILEVVSDVKQLTEAEKRWVKKLNSYHGGYNMQAPGKNRSW